MEHLAPARYYDRELRVESVKILPGQYYATGGEGSISTLLGSCVSTCFWDPLLKIGGMNHFMLPGEASQSASPWAVSARFGVYAMDVLINEMVHLGVDRRRLVAKVFGGARVLQGFDKLDVGAMNARFVLNFLEEEGIAIAAQDLLGDAPRKVHFFPATGKVQVRRLQLQAELVNQEREYLSEVEHKPSGFVELFEAPR
jgi:chemotaxis protein CheD